MSEKVRRGIVELPMDPWERKQEEIRAKIQDDGGHILEIRNVPNMDRLQFTLEHPCLRETGEDSLPTYRMFVEFGPDQPLTFDFIEVSKG